MRIAKKTNKKKLEELKKKLKNEEYLINAIESLAYTLTEDLVNKE